MNIDTAINELENGKDIRFSRLLTIVSYFFGKPRINGSHYVFKIPFRNQPLLNLQSDKGKAKRYQIKQVKQVLIQLQASFNEGAA